MSGPSIPLPPTGTLPTLDFAVEAADAVRFAAAPTVAFDVRITADIQVRSLALNTQIRIAPALRRYSDHDAERLVELFGPRERWGETLRTFRWAQASTVVPAFASETRAELAVPATYDFEVAAAKYFYALEESDVPLEFLFSGTVFYGGERAALRTAQIPWEAEATFRMPVAVWKEALDAHFPRSAWLRVDAEVFDRLAAYRARRTLPSWEATISELLERAD